MVQRRTLLSAPLRSLLRYPSPPIIVFAFVGLGLMPLVAGRIDLLMPYDYATIGLRGAAFQC
ncbi:hypothetical protein FBZ93_12716 [Bradyrhizobium macuxiense]|uniref:Uncharacterized protein n=1 Tax=Bradyrhizobium macuxiense TaxID=1755647 RepID=A0A560KUD1_9BRAD|nr:hypothetical protein FBZ93_12716 [Bradyrhizobium macuxiense]